MLLFISFMNIHRNLANLDCQPVAILCFCQFSTCSSKKTYQNVTLMEIKSAQFTQSKQSKPGRISVNSYNSLCNGILLQMMVSVCFILMEKCHGTIEHKLELTRSLHGLTLFEASSFGFMVFAIFQ